MFAREIRNTIMAAMAAMLLPLTAEAQFYTITKETEITAFSKVERVKAVDNEALTKPALKKENIKDTLEAIVPKQTASSGSTRKSYKSTSQNLEGARQERPLPELTIPNLYNEIRRNGILYPKIVLAQAILETGWFRSPLCRYRHNLFGLTNPRTGKYYEFNHWTESVRAYYTKVQYKYKFEDGNYLLWLRDIGYAEDPRYIHSVNRILQEHL